MATVKLFGNLRKLTDGSHLQVTGSNVQEVLDTICEGNPSLCDALFQDGTIRSHYKITINGRDIALAHGLETPISEDDQIAIFPPIAGG